MNEFVILNNSWWNSLSYQLPWQSEMHISKPCMWGTFSQPWRFWLNQQTGLRRDLPWNHFRHILDQDISQFQPLKRSRFYAWSSRPFTKLSVVLSQWILNPRLVKQILLLFLRPHSWLLLSLFFFFLVSPLNVRRSQGSVLGCLFYHHSHPWRAHPIYRFQWLLNLHFPLKLLCWTPDLHTQLPIPYLSLDVQ